LSGVITNFPQKQIQFTSGSITGTGKIYQVFISDSNQGPHPEVVTYVKVNYNDF
jgi:hypothetical protein